MRWSSIFILVLLFSISNVKDFYWFQSGAVGYYTSNNNGASIEIETVNQTPIIGSFGFWVGEYTSNNYFIQIGYFVPNYTGVTEVCSLSGSCVFRNVSKYEPTWFYEIIPPNGSSTFYGNIGSPDSVGPFGSFHTYKMYSIGNVWFFVVDNKTVGSAYLGSSSSGSFPATAIAEGANMSNNNEYMNPVIFYNFSIYKYGYWLPVSEAKSIIFYGIGSQKLLPNPYGVEEVNNRVNYFEAGSNIPIINNTILWTNGYYLNINSPFSRSGTFGYTTGSAVEISTPLLVYKNSSARYVFVGWRGIGIGSYTGKSNSTTIIIISNITEEAIYAKQYLVNVSSPIGNVTGGGWYNISSIANISLKNRIIYIYPNVRYVFVNWSNGNTSTSLSIVVNRPINIGANFVKQYFINVSSPIGNVTGGGWYNISSIANISLKKLYIKINNNTILAFQNWSNGISSPQFSVVVNNTYHFYANFVDKFKVNIYLTNLNNKTLNGSFIAYIDGLRYNSSNIYLTNGTHIINYILFNGNKFVLNKTIYVNGPSNFHIQLPIQNINLYTTSFLGLPINASYLIIFPNNTHQTGFTNGHILLKNVPYNSTIYVNYIYNQSYKVNSSKVNISFLSWPEIAIILIIIFGAIYARVHGFRHRRQYKR